MPIMMIINHGVNDVLMVRKPKCLIAYNAQCKVIYRIAKT